MAGGTDKAAFQQAASRDREKPLNSLLYKNHPRKMLMKLTLG